MSGYLTELIDESIRLELNVADIYLFFQAAFPEDADFWWDLALEEKNHAALIRSLKEHFLPLGKVPQDLLASSRETIRETNAMIRELIDKYRRTPPSRKEAFQTACDLEESAAEIHFQDFMSRKGLSGLDEIFQRLNADDKDHGEKLRSYMAAHGIPGP
jgi:ferritin